MMEVVCASTLPDGVVALGIPVLAGGGEEGGDSGAFDWLCPLDAVSGTEVGAVGRLLGDGPDESWLRLQGFLAAKGASLVLRAASGPPSVVLLGLGARRELDLESWRLAGAALVRAAGEGGG
ncbi:MAG: M17 family peptidase N-terminal domain-containing protein, partial [Acidimicrobiales bacterium]